MKSTPRNIPLRIGLLLLALIVGVALFGPALAPDDPMKVYKGEMIDGAPYGGPPLPALGPFQSPKFPLGMDRIGRDVLSRLLWAVRPTLVLCLVVALARIAIGMAVGIAAGLLGRRSAWLLDALSVLSGAVPLFLVAVGVLIALGANKGLLAFTLAISVTGWLNTAALVQARVQSVLHAPYLESARAIGLPPWGIFRRYVLPQIWPVLPMVLASELSAVTLIIAELGYFGFFIGGGFLYTDSVGDGPVPDVQVRSSGEPELGQMLSDFFGQYNRTPWVVLFAGCVVVLMLCAFTLLSEGFRRELDVTRPKARGGWLSGIGSRLAGKSAGNQRAAQEQ